MERPSKTLRYRGKFADTMFEEVESDAQSDFWEGKVIQEYDLNLSLQFYYIKPVTQTLQPEARVDRYGYDGSTFVSPEGTPYSQRSLAPGTENKPYTVFEVVKPVEVQSGKIVPWFGAEGGGIQYEFSNPISELLEQGILRKVWQ